MPIYDYLCSSCHHLTEVIHGINDPGPRFCPSCGAEGTMRKGISSPAVLYKGSGWAKKDRAASRSSATSRAGSDEGTAEKRSSEKIAAADRARDGGPAGGDGAGSSTGAATGSGSKLDAASANDAKGGASEERGSRRSGGTSAGAGGD